MLITNTKRKDYYDGVVGTMGIDKGLVFDRTTITIDGTDKNLIFPKEYAHGAWNKPNLLTDLSGYSLKKNSEYGAFSAFIVGFCGQHYVGWKFYKDIKNNNTDFTIEITYDYDVVKERVKIESYRSNLTDSYIYAKQYDPIEIFRRYHTPIFIWDEAVNTSRSPYRYTNGSKYNFSKPTFIINPMLQDYEFYKKVDSFQAFQEIQMFLGGVLGINEKPMIVIDDKHKIAQHGFDKWSFRKEKEVK